jgi:hypothetical protein
MFVVNEISKDKNIQKYIKDKSEKELMSYENSGKLLGLYDKLLECEVISKGLDSASSKEESKMQISNDNDGGNGSLLVDMA